jgi:hypothetical protein
VYVVEVGKLHRRPEVSTAPRRKVKMLLHHGAVTLEEERPKISAR